VRRACIYNSKGFHVATVRGDAIFNLRDEKLFDLDGFQIKDRTGKVVARLQGPIAPADSRLDALFESCNQPAPILFC
jgi:hypothetical protein